MHFERILDGDLMSCKVRGWINASKICEEQSHAAEPVQKLESAGPIGPASSLNCPE